MQCLSAIECDAWLEGRRRLSEGLIERKPIGEWPRVACVSLESVRAAVTRPLARSLVYWLLIDDPAACLAVVAEHGIGPSSENMALYYAWRRSLGDWSHLESRAGHLLLLHEGNDFVSLLQMGMIFGWDMHITSDSGNAVAWFDHDGRFEVAAAYPERLETLPDMLLPSKGAR